MQTHEPQNTAKGMDAAPSILEFPTKRTTSRRAQPRNRRRAIDLSPRKIMEIKADFEAHPNSLDIAQNHLLPRSEAVDAILMRVIEEYRSVRQDLADLRRQLGLGGADAARPFLVRRAA